MSGRTGFDLGQYGYRTMPKDLNKEEKRLLSSVFHQVDVGGKGFLSREDLKIAVAEVFGYKPSKLEADHLMESYGDSTGLNLPMFMVAMTEKMSKADQDGEIRHTFMAFDSQCRGFLTAEDLEKAVSCVAPHIPHHSIHSTFRELDRDGDGRVSYKDFDSMMKYNTSEHL
ncbi:EF-hand calcium-binding domain-containing protein 11-like [Mizuhopecten yessoensis]|uniref:EF-hand calcium-binding domain-containing protein 11 n=1 Tax=Mizuhopecten yessoensis TaxID=6573 RepID=A0A210R0B9_MIZYE|nr:EF-hand calcium-binding domain-containing protein 11-like [Mizuhopecten yessoensis]OWF54355.1 EF-hand calcium-binding domain-containing protein 11 [Mizuhopecten yessoensis]